ncbi:MAG: HlyD family efflux transporter periplasmic adaptor subunit [Rhodocyclaceae bacterium]
MKRQAGTLAIIAALISLTACNEEAQIGYQGYIEGEYLYLAAPQAGYLNTLDAERGSRVQVGQPLFAIAGDPDAEALSQAQSQAEAARQSAENLKLPRRTPEIAALEAELRAAQASLALADAALTRQQALARRNFVSANALDEARSARDAARAQVDAARQHLASYRASLGREAEVLGAEAQVRAAEAVVAQKRWAVDRKAVSAPAAGEVSDTYYRPGEWVPAGSPVASLLPDARRRLRFFVPESTLAKIHPGQAVEAHCDGCTTPIRATVDFIAPQAEYTPPVIYSKGSREKLVFRVEAAPSPADAPRLRPGLPVDVTLAGE